MAEIHQQRWTRAGANLRCIQIFQLPRVWQPSCTEGRREEKHFMKTKLLLMMLAGGSLFAETHFSIGVGIGTTGYYASAAGGRLRASALPRS